MTIEDIKKLHRHADFYCLYYDYFSENDIGITSYEKEKDNNRKRVAPSVVTIRSSYEWKWNMNFA